MISCPRVARCPLEWLSTNLAKNMEGPTKCLLLKELLAQSLSCRACCEGAKHQSGCGAQLMLCQGALQLRVWHECESRNNEGLTTRKKGRHSKNSCKHSPCVTSTIAQDRAKKQWSRTMSSSIIMGDQKSNVLLYILCPRLRGSMPLTVTSVSTLTMKYMTHDVDLFQGMGTV